MVLAMIPPDTAEPFLRVVGWANAEILPLAGDASFRRYFRVIDGERRAVLMDAPPPHEDPRPFMAVAQWLSDRGFSAPPILGVDLDAGLLLLGDFGDQRMREAIDAHPQDEHSLYRAVVDLLVALHAHPSMALPAYDRATYQRELALFTEWYCRALNFTVDATGFVAAWDAVLDHILTPDAPRVTVLRDYHAENIMLLADRPGLARLGLLDFQDALAGHPAYDLVSMLQDARRDVPADLEAEMLGHYCTATGAAAQFSAAYHILGAQRNIKILGIFCRLWLRDSKPHYLGFQPRVWRYLERDLAHPALAPVKAWFDAHIPADLRAASWTQAHG